MTTTPEIATQNAASSFFCVKLALINSNKSQHLLDCSQPNNFWNPLTKTSRQNDNRKRPHHRKDQGKKEETSPSFHRTHTSALLLLILLCILFKRQMGFEIQPHFDFVGWFCSNFPRENGCRLLFYFQRNSWGLHKISDGPLNNCGIIWWQGFLFWVLTKSSTSIL